MHPAHFLSSSLNGEADGRRRRADAWRRLHQRPDAPPLPPQPIRAGLVDRLLARIASRRSPGLRASSPEGRTAS